MLTFLFWNLHRKDLSRSLLRIVQAYSVDIVLLAECITPSAEICATLNTDNDQTPFEYAPDRVSTPRQNKPGIVEIFCRFDSDFLIPESSDDRYTIRHLSLPGRVEINLAAAHLRSALHDDNMRGREFGIRAFNREIKATELRTGNNNTIVVGDLNVNPFDEIVVLNDGFHAIAARSVAVKGGRKVGPEYYPFFYNPTWRFLGDTDDKPPGTFFRDKNDTLSYFWHLYDQVLIRPSLLDYWNEDSFSILTGDGEYSFLQNDKPDTSNFSDHLPLLFRLDI